MNRLFFILLVMPANNGLSQTDSLVFKYGDVIAGELTSLERGVVTLNKTVTLIIRGSPFEVMNSFNLFFYI